MKKITIELDDKLWKALVKQHREIQETFNDTDKSYPFEHYIYETLYESIHGTKYTHEERQEVIDTIRDKPGITPREVLDKWSDK